MTQTHLKSAAKLSENGDHFCGAYTAYNFGLYVDVDKSVSMIRMTARFFSLIHANELLTAIALSGQQGVCAALVLSV